MEHIAVIRNNVQIQQLWSILQLSGIMQTELLKISFLSLHSKHSSWQNLLGDLRIQYYICPLVR
jgi:hypothetical protein